MEVIGRKATFILCHVWNDDDGAIHSYVQAASTPCIVYFYAGLITASLSLFLLHKTCLLWKIKLVN